MEIAIDLEADEPLFAQLIEQIKKAVANDHLKPGDALPSIRQLAGDLQLNNKTVAKAYRLLERDTIIQAKGYRGTFIHPDAKAHCTTDLNSWINEELEKVVSVLREGGATDSEIRIAFSDVMNR